VEITGAIPEPWSTEYWSVSDKPLPVAITASLLSDIAVYSTSEDPGKYLTALIPYTSIFLYSSDLLALDEKSLTFNEIPGVSYNGLLLASLVPVPLIKKIPALNVARNSAFVCLCETGWGGWGDEPPGCCPLTSIANTSLPGVMAYKAWNALLVMSANMRLVIFCKRIIYGINITYLLTISWEIMASYLLVVIRSMTKE
jgi:hypothetical protein